MGIVGGFTLRLLLLLIDCLFGLFRVSRAGWGAEEDPTGGAEDGKVRGRGFWRLDAKEEEVVLAGNEYTSGPEKGLAYFFQQLLHGFWGFPPI